jgi:hypothetical protein
MANELKSWERPDYVPDGSEPFLFYVVYGEIDVAAPVGPTYRTTGIPAGIDLLAYGPQVHPEVPGSFCEGYLWDEFAGEYPELADRVRRTEHCLILRGTPSDFTSLNYLRDTVGLITFLLDHGGIAVYDPFMIRWWPVEDWKQQIFRPAAPVPSHHVVLLVSDEEAAARKWYHTRGMRKFGRPDLSVHNVPVELEAGVIELCQRMIEYQAFGHVVSDGQRIQMVALPKGGVFRHAGDLDDPDFNNVHLEVILDL